MPQEVRSPQARDREWEVRLQFLGEAQTYFDTIEAGVLGLATQGLDRSRADRILRAAHSLKGGAAMMGFPVLSELAHRLEDYFKILQVDPCKADANVERGILAGLDWMRQIAQHHRQQQPLPEAWVTEQVQPIFDQLKQQLGELQPEDVASLLSAEAGGDMRVLMFETEVDACLQRLEGVLAHPEQPCLREEFLIASQELGALGEMLDLPAFTTLCRSLAQTLEATPIEAKEQVLPLAQAALQAWRRSQALVLIGQLELLPTTWDPGQPSEVRTPSRSREQPPPSSHQPAIDPTTILSTAAPTVPARKVDPVLPAPSDGMMRVPVRQLEQLGELFGEFTTERNGLNGHLQRLRELVSLLKRRVRTLEATNSRLRSSYDRVAIGSTHSLLVTEGPAIGPRDPLPVLPTGLLTREFDLLEMDRYGEMHLLAQEVMETVVQIDEITGDIDTALQETEGSARQLTRTSRQMQTHLTQVRMQPLSDLTDRFPRSLREMSLTYGKPVELRVWGGSTLIERSILERLADPLLHLIRNAFDHGIEDPETRLAQGKPAKGLIEITAAHRGNRTLLTVRDDGAGIRLDKIRARALQMGFQESDLDTATPQELLELIFEPGFSTAAQVSDLSGRGVGMDVVRTNLEQVGGRVQVESWPGQGTLFTLTLPLSLSVTRVLLTECHGLMLAFPANAVEELLIPPELAAPELPTSFVWEDHQVPLIPLRQWFRFYRPQHRLETNDSPTIDQPTVLLVVEGNQPFGLLVDRFWREQEVTLRPVEEGLPLPPGFSGCTLLADGRIVPLVDIPALLAWIQTQGFPPKPAALAMSPLHSPSPQPTLLVVEDSVNVRRFLAMTLEKAGFRVEQARDGQEALERLQSGIPIQAVISDIEMPRLDGFGLLAQIRAHPLHHQLPVLMLTSRSGNKHRHLAHTLGASGYFSKPFQEQELIHSLRQVLQASTSTVLSGR
ncbi:hybrid sensor histidine kinase/response regulator [Thermostichus vulcanus]|uniref:histidine kinase n=1 Tax=Thermostichus vulcanus str. 'Rupite' TaxID=2813851 RepID=A0ABT0C9E9_THEVL|nr:hybrid sensor histidine kinase/response regulator [Thermostichus vulcanus]MCJ2542381.1 hybrid sensor histidine kinase/response regulator [Thermostichus vulcanus str. 'Rupite']